MDEASIIQRVQQGDAEAFGDLMDLHARRVRGIIALLVPVRHLIDELAQETFVFAFTHLHEFRRGTSFSSWLAAIARNFVRWELLRYSRDRVNRFRYASSRKETTQVPREAPDVFERALRRVAPEALQLLELRYRASLTTQEIARRTGRTDTWVRTTLSRTRRQLRDCLELKWL